ncbi:MAG: hypothetical protein EPN20_01935 [Magnetospirillum sp.]|nr:MAG: hypothetical protein EPN20_01935 [Magnetospirillum sp.]
MNPYVSDIKSSVGLEVDGYGLKLSSSLVNNQLNVPDIEFSVPGGKIEFSTGRDENGTYVDTTYGNGTISRVNRTYTIVPDQAVGQSITVEQTVSPATGPGLVSTRVAKDSSGNVIGQETAFIEIGITVTGITVTVH